jgi:PAS domain S-box-containing protein
MKSAPLPPDEPERLAALREAEILDTLPESAFDDLAQLAGHICGTPIALVSLIDEHRQWFKAKVGVEPPETSREVAFCSHAILQNDVFIVPDAHDDERFFDNPLVTGAPGVRFYAGAPLTTRDRRNVGTLCVIDRAPRTLDDAQRFALAALARQVAAQIDLRRANTALTASAREAWEAKMMLDDLLESASDLVVRVDALGRILYANSSFRKATGRSAAELANVPLVELGPPELRLTGGAILDRIMRGEDVGTFVSALCTKDGRKLDIEGSASVRFEGGRVVEVQGIFRDITERRAVERMKNEFISTVSHELRTPLTSIRGALGLLEGGVLGELPKEAMEVVQIARTSTDRLVRLINDILDVEKMESGRIELKSQPIDAARLVHATLQWLRSAGDIGVEFEADVRPEHTLIGDEDRLTQVLTNLLSNAIKFSPPGGKVRVRVEGTPAGCVRFSVQDEGPGIPAEDLPKLFGRFQQLDGADTRRHEGTGLGLWISKTIVEQHSGTIGVDSSVGKGSTFWFELPAEAERDRDTQPPPSAVVLLVQADGRHARVLVVEDDPSFREVLVRQLSSLGIECMQATNGVQAVALARKARPDLIILDVGLPRRNGFDVVATLRAEVASETPLIVYTGRDLSSVDRNALRLGMTRFFTKSRTSEAEFVGYVREMLGGLLEARAHDDHDSTPSDPGSGKQP